MNFESLPNELLFNIFTYLRCRYILHTFIGLNSRFNTLVLVHLQTHSLDFQSAFKHDFDAVCQQYLPLIIDRIPSLCLSNDNETPQEIHLFLTYGFTLRQFTNLRILFLCNMSCDETTIKMMCECYHIHNLTYLTFTNFTIQSDKMKFQSFINSIWNLPTLIYFKLDSYLPYGRYSIEPTLISLSIKQLSLSGVQPCVNPISYLFDYTPNLRKFSSSITLRPNNVTSPYAIRSVAKLDIRFSSISPSYMIKDFFQMTCNLCQLKVTTQYIDMNGHIWEEIIHKNLPELKVFQFKMEAQIDDVNDKESEVDVLVDSFRSQFWVEEHKWFVRCDWSPDKSNNFILLYTVPYAFSAFDFSTSVLFKSTYPVNNDPLSYDCVQNLHCNTILTEKLSLCNVRFRHLQYLSIKLPFNDQFWSIVPKFNQLISLTVILDNKNDLGQTQLQFLLNKTPRLHSLRIKSCLSSTEQALLATRNNTNLINLRLFSHGYSQCFYSQNCVALCASSLGRQCETLEIAVNNRTNILTLINGMPKLRVLYVYCCDDKRNGKSNVTVDELIEWLQLRLPSTSIIERDEQFFYIIRIWIR